MKTPLYTFFPDFSPDLQKHRCSFVEVRKQLREKGLTYGMLYPSKLRVEHHGSIKFFESSSDASEWLDTLASIFLNSTG